MFLFSSLVNDVCSRANGGCSTFCLPTARGRKCACPDGVNILADKKTCDGGNYLLTSQINIPNYRMGNNLLCGISIMYIHSAKCELRTF